MDLVLSQSTQRHRENDVHRRDGKDAGEAFLFPGREIAAREKPMALRARVWWRYSWGGRQPVVGLG